MNKSTKHKVEKKKIVKKKIGNKKNEKKCIKNKKWWFLGLVVTALLIVCLAIVLALVNVKNEELEEIDDSYFVSSDSKMVLSMDDSMVQYETSEYEPGITRIVYYIDGDKVNNVKFFFEYISDEQAAEAYENISLDDKAWATSAKLNGKYIVIDTKESWYDDLTAKQVWNNIRSLHLVDAVVEVEGDDAFYGENSKYRD